MSRTGGTQRMCAWLANALSAEHEVSVLCLRQAGERPFFSLKNGVKYRVLPEFSGKTGILRQIRRINRFIKENAIDRVISVDMGMGFYGVLAARGTKAKTVAWEHGNFFNNWGSRVFPYLRRYAAIKSDAVVVLTDRDRENYRQNIPGCSAVYVIPNPASPRAVSYDGGSRVILSVGHLLENKGFHRAVEMAAPLLTEHPDWTWIICGEGPERPRLEAMIRERGLEGRVLLPGVMEDMDGVYRKAALLVLTSHMEGLPMALLEGKSWGLPLVAFDIMTGPSDIISDGVNGFLVEPFDTEQMTDRIRTLMDNPALRTQMSRSAADGMEKFSEEMILNGWKKVLNQ